MTAKFERRTVLTDPVTTLPSFAIIALLGKLFTSDAISCVFPPTRMRTSLPLSVRVASRLRNGT